jgi:hypothetical protein
MKPHLPFGPAARLLAPGAVDTVLVDALGVAWLEGPRLGYLWGWGGEGRGGLLGGLPPGRMLRAGRALYWLADAGDAALRIDEDGVPQAIPQAIAIPRPHGSLSASAAEVVAPGAFRARRLAMGAVSSLPECALEGALLAWPCGGGHTWSSEGLLCRRPVGGPTRALSQLPTQPERIEVGPRGALVLLIDGQALGAAPEGPLLALPDGVDLGELRFSPTGDRLLIRDEDSLLEVILRTGEPTARWPGPLRPAGWRPEAVAWDPTDGSLRPPGGPAFALGFTAAPPAQSAALLLGPGGLAWSIDSAAHRWALPFGPPPGLDPEQLLAAAPLGDGFVLITEQGVILVSEDGALHPPLRLPRSAGAALDARAQGGAVHLLCDRAVLRLWPSGDLDENGAAECFLDEAPWGGAAAGAERSLRWTGSGLLLALQEPHSPGASNDVLDAIFAR